MGQSRTRLNDLAAAACLTTWISSVCILIMSMGNLRGKSCKWFLGEVFNPNKKRCQKRNSLLAFGIEYMGSPNSSVSKESTCNAGDTGDSGLIPESGRSPGGEKWQPIPVFVSEKSHRQRSLASYSPKGLKESDRTK